MSVVFEVEEDGEGDGEGADEGEDSCVQKDQAGNISSAFGDSNNDSDVIIKKGGTEDDDGRGHDQRRTAAPLQVKGRGAARSLCALALIGAFEALLFSMLGSIVEMTGLTGEDLGQVRFRPGSVALADGEAAKLAALAEALRERPELLLNVRGAVAPEADGLALLRESLAVAGQPVSDAAWAQARDAYLAGARSLPPEALNNLAQARGLAIQRLLTESHGVPAQQVFLRDPSRQAEVGPAGNVIVPFALDAR